MPSSSSNPRTCWMTWPSPTTSPSSTTVQGLRRVSRDWLGEHGPDHSTGSADGGVGSPLRHGFRASYYAAPPLQAGDYPGGGTGGGSSRAGELEELRDRLQADSTRQSGQRTGCSRISVRHCSTRQSSSRSTGRSRPRSRHPDHPPRQRAEHFDKLHLLRCPVRQPGSVPYSPTRSTPSLRRPDGAPRSASYGRTSTGKSCNAKEMLAYVAEPVLSAAHHGCDRVRTSYVAVYSDGLFGLLAPASGSTDKESSGRTPSPA